LSPANMTYSVNSQISSQHVEENGSLSSEMKRWMILFVRRPVACKLCNFVSYVRSVEQLRVFSGLAAISIALALSINLMRSICCVVCVGTVKSWSMP